MDQSEIILSVGAGAWGATLIAHSVLMLGIASASDVEGRTKVNSRLECTKPMGRLMALQCVLRSLMCGVLPFASILVWAISSESTRLKISQFLEPSDLIVACGVIACVQVGVVFSLVPFLNSHIRLTWRRRFGEMLCVRNIKGKVNFVIITVREEEFEAVLQRIPERETVEGGKQLYEYCRFRNSMGMETGVAVVRSVGQGPNSAQSVTRDTIEDLDPGWLILTGIAGAVPANEFSLGDVCLASRLNDFSVSAAIEGKLPEYQQTGGPMHRDVERLLGWLPAKREQMGDWNSESSIGRRKPDVQIPKDVSSLALYGPLDVKRRTLQSLCRHFSPENPKSTKFHIGPGATAGVLMKDTELLERWQKSSRHLTHVEMEAGGVFEAARHGGEREYPLLCVRGISDIIGFRRDPDWTEFACHSAAAFVHALLFYAPLQESRS